VVSKTARVAMRSSEGGLARAHLHGEDQVDTPAVEIVTVKVARLVVDGSDDRLLRRVERDL
jgi:hypothetical protein